MPSKDAKPPITLHCTVCGKPFGVFPYRLTQNVAYCSRACRGIDRRGKPASNLRTGRYIDKGYVNIRIPGQGYILEHRLVMEQHLGRPLLPTEHVHHRDGNRSNNDIANLQIVSRGEHTSLHTRGLDRKQGRWGKNHDECIECGTTTTPHHGYGLCHNCYNYRHHNGW